MSDTPIDESGGDQIRVGMRVPGSEPEMVSELTDEEERERVQELIQQTLEEEKAAHPEPKTPEEAEHMALENVFADIRHESHYGRLVTREHWEEEGFVPEHMDADSFAQLVFDTLAGKNEDAGDAAAEPDEAAEEAGKVPEGAKDAENAAADEPDGGEKGTESDPEPESEPGPVGDGTAADKGAEDERPEGAEDNADAEPDAEPSAGPDETVPAGDDAAESAVVLAPLVFDDIVVMEGTKAKYLYSNKEMTDAYAKWSFLAAEDDKVATFVSTVREESEIYPRPMRAKSLTNDPFDMTPQEVSDTWDVVRESGKYPDIETCSASNGDVYYYSTNFLEDAQAEALAEFYSVRRFMSP